MKNIERWQPTKFVLTRSGYRGSRDPRWLSVSSRIIGDLEATVYTALLQAHARGALLDFGCGRVPLYDAYRTHATSVVCVDWTDGEHVDYQMDLGQPLALPSLAFDTIVATDVLEHLPDPGVAFAEIARLLAPGGKALIAVPFLYWLHEQPHDYYRYTEFALRRFCRASRLEVCHLEPYGGALEVLADILGKVLSLARCPQPLLSVQQSLCGTLLRTTLARYISSRTAAAMPLGYCLVAQKAAAR
jgi:SAM-dependent methyltransferase